ncbi:hypothetical protein D3C73_487560 [compost metagenome]
MLDVLTVKVHAGFDPQGVPRAKADWGNPGTHQIVEETGSLIGRQNDFQPVFTGITGACDEPVTVRLAFERFKQLNQVATRLVDQLRNLVSGVGPLDSQHRQLGTFAELHVEAVEMGLHPGHVLVAGGRVDH